MNFGKTNYRTGGTRGGADHFKWEDVKTDKYRQCYLGHSVCAPVGRWQKGKDLMWYTKQQGSASENEKDQALRAEIALAKQRDEERINAALGIAPSRRPTVEKHALDPSEMKDLLRRGDLERNNLDGERVEGVGAATFPDLDDFRTKKTLAEKYKESLQQENHTFALPGSIAEKDSHNENEKKRKKKDKSKRKHSRKDTKTHSKRQEREGIRARRSHRSRSVERTPRRASSRYRSRSRTYSKRRS